MPQFVAHALLRAASPLMATPGARTPARITTNGHGTEEAVRHSYPYAGMLTVLGSRPAFANTTYTRKPAMKL